MQPPKQHAKLLLSEEWGKSEQDITTATISENLTTTTLHKSN